ncbi:MAG TPA: hydrogenase, partial [Candidatus Dormibacteraeota bacterium]|nr:hydrogenase [Candidatus Dormibacteraeota bacterium]
ANGGQGLSFLIERNNSPSRLRLQQAIQQKLPQAKWYISDSVGLDIHQRAAGQAFGRPVKPLHLFDKADVVVALDCDFLGSETDVQNNIRRFSSRRQISKPGDALNRLYVVEGLMSITGFNADHRLRTPSSTVVQVAAALAELLKGGISGLENVAKPAGVDPKWIASCAKDLREHAGKSLVVAGYRQPLQVHLLAHAINSALGNIGKTVVFHEVPEPKEQGLVELAQALNAGNVSTLIILGGNPAYTAPAELNWAAAQRKAKRVVRLGYYEDETSVGCDWHIPAAHYLESWGDALTSDGTLVPIQPLIAPLFGGLTQLEILARIVGLPKTDPYSIVRETFAKFFSGQDVEGAWRKFLHDGFLGNSAAQPVAVNLNQGAVAQAIGSIKTSTLSKE